MVLIHTDAHITHLSPAAFVDKELGYGGDAVLGERYCSDDGRSPDPPKVDDLERWSSRSHGSWSVTWKILPSDAKRASIQVTTAPGRTNCVEPNTTSSKRYSLVT